MDLYNFIYWSRIEKIRVPTEHYVCAAHRNRIIRTASWVSSHLYL